MTHQQIIELRNKKMAEAQRLMATNNSKPDAETRAKVQGILAEADTLKADADIAKSLEDHQKELRASSNPHRTTPGASMDPVENAELEKRSFREFMVSGKQPEKRDLGVGPVANAITGGSQLVAPAFYPILTTAQKFYGGVVNIVNQRATDTGAPMKVSLVSDVTAGIQPWAESSAVTEVDPSFQAPLSYTEEYNTGLITVTIEELQDSAWNLDSFIQDIFGQRLYRGLARYISQGSTASGSAIGAYVSYLNAAVSGATSAKAGSIGYTDLLALYNSVDPAYIDNATWVMNSTTRGALMGVTDQIGRPLFQQSTTSGPFDSLLGRPIVLDQSLPNIGAGSTSLVLGDFKAGYTLRNVGSFSIFRDPYTYMTTKGSVAFVGYGRGGSFSTDAGTHPIKYLTQAAS